MDEIRIEEGNGHLKLYAPPEINVEVSAAVKDIVNERLENGEVSAITFDISALSVINSCGIGLLVALHTKCQGNNAHFFVFKPTSHVRKTLELVQLTSFFDILD